MPIMIGGVDVLLSECVSFANILNLMAQLLVILVSKVVIGVGIW